MAEKYPTSSSTNLIKNPWRSFSPESVARFFLNLRTHTRHHSTQSCKTLQLRRNRHHYCTEQTNENIRNERQASDIFSSIRRSGISCDSHHLYEFNWTLHSSVTCISKKKYETRTNEWHTAWINPRVPSLGMNTERHFFPVVSSFHQTYRDDKRRSCYHSTGRTLFTHQEPGDDYCSSKESCALRAGYLLLLPRLAKFLKCLDKFGGSLGK